MFFGRNCIEKNGAFFKKYGTKAVVFTTQFPAGHINMGLEDIKKTFDANGIEYLVIDRVYTDPPVEIVHELSRDARAFEADFFIAVGGGSAIDTAKAVALLLKYPADADPYEVFWGDRSPSDAIQSELDMPLFTVPTTAGTGAEATPFAVLTRADIHTKRTMYHNAYPTAAFLDARYISMLMCWKLAGVKSYPLQILNFAIYGIGGVLGTTGISTYAIDMSNRNTYKTINSIYVPAYSIGGMIVSPFMGKIADATGGYGPGYAVLAVLCVVGYICTMVAYKIAEDNQKRIDAQGAAA